MQTKIKSILVLSILLMAALTGVAAADENKIKITYIGYKPSVELETASQTCQYSSFIEYTYINYYDSSKDSRVNDDILEAAESGFFETQDVVFCSMVSADAYKAVNDSLKAAHDNGTSLVSIKTKLVSVPEYFDDRFYHSPNDTISDYYNNMGTSGKGLENAENLLIYLAQEYGNHPEITDSWGTITSSYDKFLFILGTDLNKNSLIAATQVEDIDLQLNTTVLSTDEVPDDFNFSQYGVIFLESQPEELVNVTWRSSISTAKAAGAQVVGYNLSENITLTNVDLYSDDCTAIERFWIQGGETNMEYMLKVMAQKFAGLWTTKTYTPEILQEKMNVTFILNQDTNVYYLNCILNERDVITDRFNVNVMTGEEAVNSTTLNLTNEDVIILYMVGANELPEIKDELLAAQANGTQIGTFGMLTDVYGIATFDMYSDEYSVLIDYFDNGGYDNMESWIRRIGVIFGNVYIESADPAEPEIPSNGIYHPDAFPRIFSNSTEYLEWYADRGYNESALTVGIISGSFGQTNLSFYTENALIRELESMGCNVISTTAMVCNDDVEYFLKDDEVLIDSAISIKGFYLNYTDHEAGVEYLQNTYNVPVLKAVQDRYQTPDKYNESTSGLSSDAIYWQVSQPEIDGLTDYIWVAGRVLDEETNEYYYETLDCQVEWISERAIAWAELGETNNSDKKVSIIYYNHEGGKNNIGASYLDIGPSFTLLMDAMKEAGYDLGNNTIPNGSEFIDLFITSRNVGTWAPGELEKVVESGYVTMVPVDDYLQYYNELPESVREEIEETWGEAPGDVMTYENESGKYFVIPTIQLGNVNFIPQPTRAGLSDESLIYHNSSIPPTHQYLATYFWINNDYDADAMIHFGTHGTQEWLPGNEVGLWRYDYPSIMVAETPVIYPYIMDNVGEGTQAKRRGNAVIISHLTPAIVEAGLYGDLATMKDKMDNYQDAKDDNDSAMMALYRNSTIQLYGNLSLSEDLGFSTDDLSAMTDDEFSSFLDSTLEEYLEEIRDELIPYGLHIFGVAPEDFKLVSMVKSMLGDDFTDHIYNVLSEGGGTEEQWKDEANVDATLLLNETLVYGTNISVAQTDILGDIDDSVTSDLELALEYADNLEQTTREINQTLKALNAEYIEPGTGNDPIRNPNALPTGTNFYSFDQRLIPDDETEAQGRVVINEWLDSYYEENGEYPNKVAFILWSVETMRHEGLMEAQIYELLGVEPVRSSGRLTGEFTVIPAEELGHPRIDVLMVPSGLYRDTFPFQLELLDNAVRAVADLDETNETNYVRMNSLAIEDSMLELGYNETIAHYISRSRIFSEAEGTYGTGVSSAIEASDSWDNVTEVGDLFISRMSNIYGADVWGVNYEDVFKLNLVSLDAAIHSDSSNLYALMDNDDVFQYLGGLDLAYLSLTGNWLSLYIADYTDVDNLEIVDFSEAISKELSARYLNPRWWSAALEHGYAGAREISNVLAYIQGMDLTTGEISDSDWNKLFDAYVNNADYEQYNEAYQAGMATMIDSIRTDAWNDATDGQKASLISEYIESVLDSEAPACCHHTCGNLANQEYMLSLAELYMDQDQVKQYKTIMAESTNLDIYKASTDTSTPDPELSTSDRHSGNSITRSMAASSTSNQSSTTKTGMGENVNVNPENTPKSTTENYVEGYEMVKDTISDEPVASSYSVSGSDILASALVLALLGAIYVGFWKRRKF